MFPYIGNSSPNGLIFFQRGGSTTNQLSSMIIYVYIGPTWPWLLAQVSGRRNPVDDDAPLRFSGRLFAPETTERQQKKRAPDSPCKWALYQANNRDTGWNQQEITRTGMGWQSFLRNRRLGMGSVETARLPATSQLRCVPKVTCSVGKLMVGVPMYLIWTRVPGTFDCWAMFTRSSLRFLSPSPCFRSMIAAGKLLQWAGVFQTCHS
jgi:hypothetical protein